MAYIKKKSKEYNPTEATAHMRTKKKFWIKKKQKKDIVDTVKEATSWITKTKKKDYTNQ